MSGPIIVIERPETISPSISKASQITELYNGYEPIVYHFIKSMETLHGEYLAIAAPIAHELARVAANGHCMMMDDFIEGLHHHAILLRQHTKEIEKEFEKQRRAACNLARMAR